MLDEKQTPDLLTCPPAELSQDAGTREQTQPCPSGEEIPMGGLFTHILKAPMSIFLQQSIPTC